MTKLEKTRRAQLGGSPLFLQVHVDATFSLSNLLNISCNTCPLKNLQNISNLNISITLQLVKLTLKLY